MTPDEDGRGASAADLQRRRAATAREALALIRPALPADRSVDLRLAGDGRAEPGARAHVVVGGPDALARLLWPISADAFGEAYLRGDIEIEGDFGAAIDAGRALDAKVLAGAAPRIARLGLELRRGAGSAPVLERRAWLTGRRHSRARDMAAIRFHYDVGNEFYATWLDSRLVYSCAYFETPDTSLDAAQEAKLDLVCRKLRLGPGTRLLDIGCGWGSLVFHAAERYGAEATGITLSAAQADWAAKQIRQRQLEARAVVAVRDYRDLRRMGSFDAVASVGMFEHVGRDRLEAYFRSAFAALRPGGLFLNHGIATADARGRSWLRRLRPGDGGFLGRYVFPDGELVTVEEAIAVARRCGFELVDVQSLRPHYALTLAAWVERLESHAGAARALAGEEVFRTWRLYMTAARRGFEEGSLDVAQILLARPAPGGPSTRPLRPWW